jgi:chemotaxis receptor (MCP) glutamine deamidase CheD
LKHIVGIADKAGAAKERVILKVAGGARTNTSEKTSSYSTSSCL